MNGWLLLSLWITFMFLNILDAVLTRIALRKGYHERIRFTRALIEECGLDKAMLVKSLYPLAFLIPIILLWNYPIMNLILDIIFVALIVWYFYVVLHNWREFATERARRTVKSRNM